jgi:peptidoglycan/LPS O-acetylase OafA/YrhL
MRVRNHALDGLRGLAALGVLTLHVWMFTVQGAHGRDELVSLLTGELRLGVVLFFVLSGYLLAGPWVASALEDRPKPRLGRFAARRAARIVPAYWAAMVGSFWLLSGTGHDYEVSAGQLPLFAAFGQNYVASAAGRLDPPMWSLVVEVSFYAVLPLAGWLLVRAARRGRMVVLCGGLAGLGLAWSAAGVLLAWPETAMSTLPTFLPVFACGMGAAALAHRRGPSRASWWALVVAGVALVCADAWWHHQGTGMTGHIVRDLPAALGFAAVVAAVAAHPPAVLSRAPLRGLGDDLLRPVPLAPARAAVAALRGRDGRRVPGGVARGLRAERARRVGELGARRATRHRGRRALAPVDAPCPELPGRPARQAGADRGVTVLRISRPS